MNKDGIRKMMLASRKNLTADEVNAKSNEIFENIKRTRILDYNNILMYLDFKNEVKTEVIINFLQNNGRVVYLPKCDIQTGTFAPVVFSNEYSLNKYGIREPNHKAVGDEQIDCAVVPGVAFDTKGNRIGFGAGYYDKFFSDNPQVFKIGLCYEFQLCDEITANSFDVPMDVIVTEKKIIHIK